MKKNQKTLQGAEERILGRQLARQVTPEDLEKANGSGRPTFTLTYPPDHD